MKFNLVSLLALTFLCATSFAAKDKGGGVGYECSVPGSKKTRVYLADTYPMFKGVDLKTDAAIIPAIAQILEETHPEKVYPSPYSASEKVSLGWMLMHLESTRPIQAAYGNEDYQQAMDLLGDDNIPASEVPAGCKKVQLAIQWFPYRIAEYDPYLRARMSNIEFEFLKLHELLVSLRNAPGMTTQPIRGDVNYLAEVLKDPRLSNRKVIERLLHPENRFFQKFTKKQTRATLYLRQHCDSKTRGLSALRDSSCAKALAKYKEELDQEMKLFTLPQLAQIPAHLQCVALAKEEYSFAGFVTAPNVGKDNGFRIRRVWGDGRENVPWNFDSKDYEEHNGVVSLPLEKAFPNETKYMIKFDDMSLLTAVPSKGSAFARLRVDKSSAFEQSPFKFTALFSRGALGHTVELNEYNEFTNEFIGYAIFNRTLGPNVFNQTLSKIHCRAVGKVVWE